MTIALQEWLRRIPEFGVLADAEILGHMGPTLGFNRLPLSWTPAR